MWFGKMNLYLLAQSLDFLFRESDLLSHLSVLRVIRSIYGRSTFECRLWTLVIILPNESHLVLRYRPLAETVLCPLSINLVLELSHRVVNAEA